MIRRIDKFVGGSILGSTAIILVLSMSALLLEESVRLANAFVANPGTLDAYFRMLLFLLPEYLTVALQVSFFLSAILAFRHLKHENALTAFFASGQSLLRIAAAPLCLSVAFGGVAAYVGGVMQPTGAYLFEETGFHLRNGGFGPALKPGLLTRVGEDLAIRVTNYDRQSGRMSNVFIESREADGTIVATTSLKGRLRIGADNKSYALFLIDGRQIRQSHGNEPSGVLQFNTLDLPPISLNTAEFREFGARAKEAPFGMLRRGMKGKDPTRRAQFKARFDAIIINSLAYVPLAALGVILGASDPVRRKGASFAIGLFIYILFVQSLSVAEVAAAEPGSSVAVLWVPFLTLFSSCFALLAQRLRQ